MIKQNRPETKKTLVRNTSLIKVGKSVTVLAPSTMASTSKVSSLNSQISRLSLDTNNCSNVASKGSSTLQSKGQAISRTKFNTPDLQSTLKLSKKIDEVVKSKRTKSTSGIETNRLAIDEKVTRKVNLPLYKPVFKDLISISSYESKTQKVLPVRAPKPPTDLEPKLEDFLEPRKVKEYVSMPKINIQSLLTNSKIIRDSSSQNLRLYSLLQVQNETKIILDYTPEEDNDCNSVSDN